MRRRLALIAVAVSACLAHASARAQLDAGIDAGVALRFDAGAAPAPIDVTVVGARSLEQRRSSAEAVTIVDLGHAQQESADLGEVLARVEGVAIRRAGGLGSDAQVSLNGLWGQQIRTFVDGVPSGLLFPFDIASVPIQLVRQVEVFRGVVPIRFGADALGGAINLLPRERLQTGGEASLQAGSFGTVRALLGAGWAHPERGLYADASGFYDRARNDYTMGAEAPDAQGRPQPVRVKRFHDAYAAGGGALELGVRDQPWAKRLSVRGYASAYRREFQHDLRVTRAEGEDEIAARTGGVLARYEVAPTERVELGVLAVYAQSDIERTDPNRWVHDWFGRRVAEVRLPRPIDNVFTQQDVYTRATLSVRLAEGHVLRFATTPAVTRYGGDNRVVPPGGYDAFDGRQRLWAWVSGIEHQADLAGDRLQNIAFVKAYVYRVDSTAPLAANLTDDFSFSNRSAGAGDGLRLRITRWLYAKASYEYATRLPSAYEVFGDGAFVLRNLALRPERSHNLNFGPTLRFKRPSLGELRIELTGITRQTKDQIVALPVDNVSHANLSDAFAWGVDAALHWSGPRRWVAVDLTQSYVDSRNRSDAGTFAATRGDRIPNRPWLFASGMLRGRWEYVPGVRVEPFYYGRYVHAYYFGWESFGVTGFKRRVPRQIVHSLGISNVARLRDRAELTATFEVQNLSDETVFDQFRVPRPGRAFYGKLSLGL